MRALSCVIECSPGFVCGGFQIEMTAEELAVHFDARARWYQAAAERVGDRQHHWLPHGSMRARDSAIRRAADFRYLLTHLITGASYRVDADELEYLELVVPRTSLLRLIRRELR